MRRLCGLLLSCALLSACGSNGDAVLIFPTPATSTPTNSGNGGATPTNGGGTPTRTPTGGSTSGPSNTPTKSGSGGTPTRTPTRIPGQAKTLYVRMSGSDSNAGTSPGAALRTVGQAAKLLVAGTTVYVGPGHYTEPAPATPTPGSGRISIDGVTGTASAPVQLIADITGAHTGDAPGEVVLDAGGDTVALIVTKTTFLTVDGFTVTGALPQTTPAKTSGAQIGLRSASDNVTIRNCVIGNDSTADGITITGSINALVFDNLVVETDRGVVITGASTGARLINNTIVNSQRDGIELTEKDMVAPTGATVTNNIIEHPGPNFCIDVGQGPPSAQDGYAGDFNLVFEPNESDQTKAYNPTAIRGANDVNSDAKFVDLSGGDVHLDSGSPAIDTGSDAIDASLVSALLARSTQADGSLDSTPPDMGYHYPP